MWWWQRWGGSKSGMDFVLNMTLDCDESWVYSVFSLVWQLLEWWRKPSQRSTEGTCLPATLHVSQTTCWTRVSEDHCPTRGRETTSGQSEAGMLWGTWATDECQQTDHHQSWGHGQHQDSVPDTICIHWCIFYTKMERWEVAGSTSYSVTHAILSLVKSVFCFLLFCWPMIYQSTIKYPKDSGLERISILWFCQNIHQCL